MNAIEFENVGKQYRLGLVSTGTIAHDLNRWWTMNILRKEDPYLKIGETNDRSRKGSSDYVWALRDINFNIEQGDVVGIIGKNGAGKSTLLKLLSRVTTPSVGEIRARGRIASLLEVGTGFHPEMTGRENIYMNGAIMGMTKAEITSKLDEIVDFSGCERYIDTPVKRYSSGMTVRLGFAIAAHLEPEILVVDEVLAVGDAEFQKKAIGKMQEVSQGGGRTVLFVSHNMASIKKLCKHGILLENGQVKTTGLINDVVNAYINKGGASEDLYFDDLSKAPGNEKVRIKSFEIRATDGSGQIDIQTGIDFKLCFQNYVKGANMDVGFHVFSLDDTYLFAVTCPIGEWGVKDSEEGMYTATFHVPPYTINAGKYKVEARVGESQARAYVKGVFHYMDIEENLSDRGYALTMNPGTIRLKNVMDIKKIRP